MIANAMNEMEVMPEDAEVIDPDAEADDAEALRLRREAIAVMYGSACPLLEDDPTDDMWASWTQGLWHERAMVAGPVLHRAEHLRMMRDGVQWISSKGNGPWREPPKPKDAVRKVVNMIGPAMDWRLQVLTEQKPGIRLRPKTTDPADTRRAQASQMALEYQHSEQNMQAVIREAAYWAQTDGAAFVRMYWDDEAGPDSEQFGGPLGDVRPRVYRVEQVRVSANATSTRKPQWWVLKEVMPLAEAVAAYGETVADESGGSALGSGLGSRDSYSTSDFANPNETNTVDRFTVFLTPNKRFLPDGLEVVVVGSKVVSVEPLAIGMVSIFRITDGSTDPAFFPKPVATGWVDDQMTLNAAYSKFVENVRRNAGGQYFAKSGALVTDSLRGGQDSVTEVRAPGDLDNVIKQVQGFSIGNDAEKLIQAASKRLEDLTGFNETARGGVSSDMSGRAILAVREQLERVFAPSIYAVADAMREWGVITLAWMRWGYEVPRMIATLGHGRPDLGREISAEDMDPSVGIELEAESMFPTPRSLRLFTLDDLFAKGLIGGEEYRKRLNFGMTNDMATPDSLHEARAMRICDAIRQGQPPVPMLWQDDEAIHQDVLERELILIADTPDDHMMQAQMRWQELAQQQAMKMGGLPPETMPGAGSEPPPEGETMPPQTAPTAALPGVGIAAAPLMQAQTTQSQAAQLFEQSAPR